MSRSLYTLVVALILAVLLAAGPASAKGRKNKKNKANNKPVQVATEAEAATDADADDAEPTGEEPEEKPAEDAGKKASEAEKTEKGSAEPAAPTHTVKKGPFRVEISLEGQFEAERMSEVLVRPKRWSQLEVLEAAEHGARVKRGDLLVQFETEDIDRAIADRQTALRLSELSIREAEEQLALLETAVPIDLEIAARSKRMADEDLARFLEVDQPMNRKSAKFSLEMSQNILEYQKEELRQLEKMYNADDLTEETEEIVLKRQRDMVRRAEFYVEQAKVSYDEAMKLQLPRAEESMKLATERESLLKRRTDATLPITLKRERIGLEKLKVQHEREQQELDELVADRKLLTVKSPAAGMVYYGRCQRGEWSGGSSAADDLRRGGSVSANEVFMTIVQTRPLRLRVTVPEKELHWMREGLDGTVKPTGFPDVEVGGTVVEVDEVPSSSGKFGAVLALKLRKKGRELVPGLKAKVELVPYEKDEALTLPASAVATDEKDGDRKYVCTPGKDGKPTERTVKVGHESDGRVEILGGLKAGDKVLKECPKDED